MNIVRIMEVFARNEVDAILIGGVNFLLQHQPVLTFDVDFWIRDTEANLAATADALRELQAQWGRTEAEWSPIPLGHDWLKTQGVYCLTTEHGPVDIFRTVTGLASYEACLERSGRRMLEQVPYRSLADADMLACQMALSETQRRLDRVAYFQKLLGEKR